MMNENRMNDGNKINNTAIIYHEDYLKHDAGILHPERKERLIETIKYLNESGLMKKLKSIKPKKATEFDLERVHSSEYIERIKTYSEMGGYQIDMDTYIDEKTFEIAKLAAGGVMLAGDLVMSGNFDNSYALVRPPGHHAKRDKAAGFCYFNNVAVAVRYLQSKYKLKRIMIFDWDSHAADGTMSIFWNDPSVLNISIHQNPATLYPGTGFINQIGGGDGEGYTVNIPMYENSCDSDYIFIIKNFVIPIADSYKPELIIISAGMDSHKDDPLSSICLTERGYSEMSKIFVELAERLCRGRIFAELEGGYNLEALSRSNYEIFKSLLGEASNYKISDNINNINNHTMGIFNELRDLFAKYHRFD